MIYRLILLTIIVTVMGCSMNDQFIRPTSDEVVASDEDGVEKSIIVSGMVNQPGISEYKGGSIGLRNVIAQRGDIAYEKDTPIFVEIDKTKNGITTTHFLPAELISHPKFADIQLTHRDRIRVANAIYSSLFKNELTFWTSKKSADVQVAGISELVEVAGTNSRPPKLEDIRRALNDYGVPEQLPPMLVLTRMNQSVGRVEVFYIPRDADLYKPFSERPNPFDLVTFFLSNGRLNNGDQIQYAYVANTPVVLENVLKKLVDEQVKKRQTQASSTPTFDPLGIFR